MRPLDGSDLQAFIDARGLDAAILPMDRHTATVAEAAAALGVDSQRIIKSLLFVADQQPVLVINAGMARVDRKKLAAHLGLNRKRVKFASSDQVLEMAGYAVGGMPPFGHRQRLRTLVDTAVIGLTTVYGGGGAVDAMMRLSTSELMRATQAEAVDLCQ
jgi:Cys-tRNA(Pro) deacylase